MSADQSRMTAEAREIARKLTKAQRRAMADWPLLVKGAPEASAEALGVKVPTMDALAFARLCAMVGRGHLTAPRQAMWCITPLGLQVRAILMEPANV